MALIWIIFVLSSFVFLPLNVILAKRNKKEDLSDVTTVLRVVCSVQAILDILVYTCSLFFLVQEVIYEHIFSAEYIRVRNIGGLILVLLIILDCLVLHGIKFKHSGYFNVFLITHSLLFGLTFIATFYTVYTLTDFGGKAIVIFLFISLITTIIFLTRIGYKTALYRIFLAKEKPMPKKNQISTVEARYYIDDK